MELSPSQLRAQWATSRQRSCLTLRMLATLQLLLPGRQQFLAEQPVVVVHQRNAKRLRPRGVHTLTSNSVTVLELTLATRTAPGHARRFSMTAAQSVGALVVWATSVLRASRAIRIVLLAEAHSRRARVRIARNVRAAPTACRWGSSWPELLAVRPGLKLLSLSLAFQMPRRWPRLRARSAWMAAVIR